MPYKNTEDQRAASKQHYRLNKDRYLSRNKSYRRELNSYVQKIKEAQPCTDCGKRYPYYVMDFDHIKSEDKMADISYLAKTGRVGALRKEVQKCELVCANCHRIRSHLRLQKVQSAIE